MRVCEEITRFILDDRALTRQLKTLRHSLDTHVLRISGRKDRLQQRNSAGDVGFSLLGNELRRRGLEDIFFANIQRVKESIRVLEEFGKLKDRNAALAFKKMRYALYTIEKKAYRLIESLSHTR